MPALRSLASGGEPNRDGRAAVGSFLDMHLERGRYADQSKVTMPAARGNFFDGSVEMIDMALGDRLTLSRDLYKDSNRLDGQELERWRWRVLTFGTNWLITGDGAVLRFGHAEQTRVVTFPHSPSKLLMVGDDVLDRSVPFNWIVFARSRRWLVDHVDGPVARELRFRRM